MVRLHHLISNITTPLAAAISNRIQVTTENAAPKMESNICITLFNHVRTQILLAQNGTCSCLLTFTIRPNAFVFYLLQIAAVNGAGLGPSSEVHVTTGVKGMRKHNT